MSYNMFEGQKVRLRGLRADDWQVTAGWDLDSEANRFGWQVWPPKGDEAAKEWAREESLKKPVDGSMRLMIDTLEGETVGAISVRPDARRFSFEYGINLDRAHWGHGFAEEAIRLACRYMFGELRMHKAQAYVYAFNKRSLSMHRKLGMVKEGVLREAQFTDGRFWDTVIFGMTADEFFARYGPNWGSEQLQA